MEWEGVEGVDADAADGNAWGVVVVAAVRVLLQGREDGIVVVISNEVRARMHTSINRIRLSSDPPVPRSLTHPLHPPAPRRGHSLAP